MKETMREYEAKLVGDLQRTRKTQESEDKRGKPVRLPKRSKPKKSLLDYPPPVRATMEPEELHRLYLDCGYVRCPDGEYRSQGYIDHVQKMRVMNPRPTRQTTAFGGTSMTFGSGRSRFNHYSDEDVGDPGFLPDLDSPETRAWCEREGHRYVDRPDGMSGPASFGNTKDLNRCMRDTGHARWDKVRLTDKVQAGKDDFRKHHGEQFTPGKMLRLNDQQVAEMFE